MDTHETLLQMFQILMAEQVMWLYHRETKFTRDNSFNTKKSDQLNFDLWFTHVLFFFFLVYRTTDFSIADFISYYFWLMLEDPGLVVLHEVQMLPKILIVLNEFFPYFLLITEISGTIFTKTVFVFRFSVTLNLTVPLSTCGSSANFWISDHFLPCESLFPHLSQWIVCKL
jgi:hypothetical protein